MNSCWNCGGSGTEYCSTCQGGSFPELDYGNTNCTVCDGEGYHPCTVCAGTGNVDKEDKDSDGFFIF